MSQRVRRDRVFISYRRSDSAGYAGRLNEDLTRLLGRRVFMDVADIAPGAEFEDVIRVELRSCGAVLAVIGQQWRDAFHAPRDGKDYVRVELLEALGHEGVNVVPVLVQGASLPSTADLPQDLQSLASRQAVAIRDDRWKDDVEHLARELRRLLKLRRTTVWPVAIGCTALTAIGLWIGFGQAPQPSAFDRGKAHAITIAAAQKAAAACSAPKGSEGECPVLFRFVPDGKTENVYYDAGFCAFKGTEFGDCLLRKLANVRIPPFDNVTVAEVELAIRVEASGTVNVAVSE